MMALTLVASALSESLPIGSNLTVLLKSVVVVFTDSVSRSGSDLKTVVSA